MSTRVKLSVLLLAIGLCLAMVPQGKPGIFKYKKEDMLQWGMTDSSFVSVDEVAGFITGELPGILLVDVRTSDEFRQCRLPGSVTIPLSLLAERENLEILLSKSERTIFYSDGNDLAVSAAILATGLGCKNCLVMKGGLNKWFEVVMNSSFTGDRITSRENALFSGRVNARKLFNEYNTLPDSLKDLLFKAKESERIRLDGGCE